MIQVSFKYQTFIPLKIIIIKSTNIPPIMVIIYFYRLYKTINLLIIHKIISFYYLSLNIIIKLLES